MLIAQLSDLHIGGARHEEALLSQAIAEINDAGPDLVVIAGDITDEGYPDQYAAARDKLRELRAARVIAVPGNHDSRHVGYLQFERTFGERDSTLRMEAADGTRLALVAVDSSKPDVDEGEVGREHYRWIQRGFAADADLRVFVCHHHLMPIPGTGRERNQVHDAGDVLALLRQAGVDLVLSGHRHVPYVWPVAGILLVQSGTVATRRTRAFTEPAYNLIWADSQTIAVELHIPGGGSRSMGRYPRDWPPELVGRSDDPLLAR